MDILTFIDRNALNHRQLDGLICGRHHTLRVEQLNTWLFGSPTKCDSDAQSPDPFKTFKAAVESYARNLYGSDRLDLYLEVHDLIVALNDQGYVTFDYKLNDSFLSHDEVNLIILKHMQEPITQERIGDEVLRCHSNSVIKRLKELQDGYRLADMSIQISPERGGKLQSTVHPILLPLNLSEVFVLLSALREQTRGLNREGPHWAILHDLAEKVYFQLTDYARNRIKDRLFDCDFQLTGDTPPIYVGDQRTHDRHAIGNSMSWAFFEKAHKLVEVVCVDGAGNESTFVGYIDNWSDASPYVDESSGINPKHCFLVEGVDGSVTAVSWEDVIDIRSTTGNGDAPDVGGANV